MIDRSENIRILYIEDDEIDQMVFKQNVKSQNLPYDLKIVNSVASTQEIIESEEEFDLIIADYILTDGDVFDVIEIINDIPIIFITGSGNQDVAVKAMKIGVYDYIVKDINREYLKLLPLQIDQVLRKYENKNRIEFLESAIINSNDSIAIFDYNSNIFQSLLNFWNPSFGKLFSCYGEQLYTLGDILNIEQNRIQGKLLFDLIINRSKDVLELLITLKNKEEPIWIEISSLRMESNKNQQNGKLVIFTRDITKRKKDEQLLVEAKARAEEAKKAEQQFLAVMSHEIRTPITSITGLTNLLIDTPLDGIQVNYLNAIKNSTELLLALVNDILDLSKIEKNAIQFSRDRTNLYELLSASTLPFIHLAENKHIEFVLNFDKDLKKNIVIDATRLNQIIVNLVSNAVKFTNEGKVELLVEVIENSEETYVLRFTVKDTGVGISKEKLPLIFDKYKQLDASLKHQQKGTGLGLYIVKHLIRLFGSELFVKSIENEGTTFTFDLKVEKVNEEAESIFEEIDYSLDGKNILIVEDNELNCEILSKIISGFKANPILAYNGLQAIKQVIDNKHIDIILMDINMPEMDGNEAVSVIRNGLNNDIPIIILSASNEQSFYQTELESQVDGIVSKPYKLESLKNQLCNVLSVRENSEVVENIKQYYDLTPLRKLTGSKEFVLELLKIYYSQTLEFSEEIANAIKDKNYHALQQLAHKLKSSAMHINNKSLEVTCKLAEKAGIDKKYDKLILLSELIIEACLELRTRLGIDFPGLTYETEQKNSPLS